MCVGGGVVVVVVVQTCIPSARQNMVHRNSAKTSEMMTDNHDGSDLSMR